LSCRLGAFVVLSLGLLGASQSALASCRLAKIVELPVTMSGLQPMVAAQINGVDQMFIVDSGAFFSMISRPKAAELKLSLMPLQNMRLEGVGGEETPSETTVRAFTLVKVPLKDVEFIVAGGGLGDAAGLLGQNVLGLADVEYDLGGGAVRLMLPKDCENASLAYWNQDQYSVMRISPTDEADPHTIGEAVVNGVKIHVIFDTGAGLSVMTLKAAARLGITPTSPGVVPAGESYGIGRGTVRTWIAPITSLQIGDEQINNTKIRIGDMQLDDADMLLGADFFLSHRVYVANSQHRLYFTYNGGPVFNLSGATKVKATAADAAKPSPIAELGPEPTDAAGFSRRGAAFAARQDFGHALADLDRACKLAPTEAKYFHQRALARLANNQPLLAMTDLDQTLKLDPGDIDALLVRAQLRLSEDAKVGAGQDLDLADHAATQQSDMRVEMGGLYEGAGRLKDAIAQYGLWIASHADDPRLSDALNGRCWARTLTGADLDLALRDCNRALQLHPKTAAYLDSRGLVHLRRGEFDKAVADYDAALTIKPDIAWSHLGRGLAKLKLGQTAAGQADVAQALKLEPKLPDEAQSYGIAIPTAPGGG